MKQLMFSVTRKDLRIDTFRSGGPGGQHQNKIESGVRITHLPSGLKGESREERSQHANKIRAFRRLTEKLLAHYVYTEQKQRAAPYSDTIRTYHEPDNRVVDKACEKRWTYTDVVVRGDIAGPLEERRRVLREQAMRDVIL